MEKKLVGSSCKCGLKNDDGRVVVHIPDTFSAKVTCDLFKYLSMKGIRTHFIDHRNVTSFNAIHCKPLGFRVAVKSGDGEEGIHTIDFLLNDCTRNNPIICAEEQYWRLLHEGEEIGKIEPLLSVREEMMARSMADNAFKALKRAFQEKADADLLELCLEFGRPTCGYWVGKLVLAGIITSKECRVSNGDKKNAGNGDFHLAVLTEKFFS